MNKKSRVHCSDEKFLEAVYNSNTYAEIADKTGQQVTSTMARFSRIKKQLSKRGIDLPEMKRKKTEKSIDNVENMIAIVQRLKAHHSSR